MSDYLLSTKNITKTFPGVRALHNICLEVESGTVHGIVGENGAGKSTLMNILSGIIQPNSGDIFLNGKKAIFANAREAQDQGIGIVFQELSLVPSLSIAENIFTNRQPVGRLNNIKQKVLLNETTEILKLFKLDHLDPLTLVRDISLAYQQVVEILKVIALNPKILILDEPTSSLGDIEKNLLFKNIREFKKTGMSIIYISHHLHEILEICDVVSVLRDGEQVCKATVSDINEDFLIKKMVGRQVQNIYGQRPSEDRIGEEILVVKNLCKLGKFIDVSFNLYRGEIIAFSGLIGAGRTEVGRALFGADPATSGEIWLQGRKIAPKKPSNGIKLGIGYMCEDRKNQGLYMDFDIMRNVAANRLQQFARHGVMREKMIADETKILIEKFDIIATGPDQILHNISGGNQQKILLCEWISTSPKVLIVDEATRGVDVGAKSDIYRILRNLAATGIGIIVISSDLQEVLHISDRIVVMKNGRIVGQIDSKSASEEIVVSMMTVSKSKDEARAS